MPSQHHGSCANPESLVGGGGDAEGDPGPRFNQHVLVIDLFYSGERGPYQIFLRTLLPNKQSGPLSARQWNAI